MGIINDVLKLSLVPIHTLLHLYKTFVQPVLCYGSEAWKIRTQDINRITAPK